MSETRQSWVAGRLEVLAGPVVRAAEVQDIEDAIDAYRHFDEREAGWMKVELAPD